MQKENYVTNKTIFEWIIEDVKARNMWPEEIEYSIAEGITENIKDYHFSPCFILDQGSCEGYYMELYIKGQIDNSKKSQIVRLGSIKTLMEGEKAVRMMATLYGECLISYKKVIDEHLDELTRSGFSMTFYDKDDKRITTYVGFSTVEDAENKFVQMQKYSNDKYHHVVIVDNDNGEETRIDAKSIEGSL